MSFNDDNDPIVTRQMSYDGVVAYVKRLRGKTIFIYAAQFAPSKNQDGVPKGQTRGREVTGHVVASKPLALRFLEGTYHSERTRTECNISVSESSRCFFIGSGP